jgi:hypothetical protein
MPEVFDALPGHEVPVAGIRRGLAGLWAEAGQRGEPTLEADDAKATQVNFVLHLGLGATPADAQEQFATVVKFSRRHPGRVVVLCPLHADVPTLEMRAKVYGECFLGRTKSDKRCVEFVMLSYSRSARPFLENQVSICLSTDLPLYYWAHRFSASGRLADYTYLLGRAKRVLLDSAIAPADALDYPWPNPRATRDLVYSRLLPIRQSIGQFLAAYRPAVLAEGLGAVTVAHAPALAAEARVLLAWLRRRLTACGAAMDAVQAATEAIAEGQGAESGAGLKATLAYSAPGRSFRWRGELANGRAIFQADFGTGRTELTGVARLLEPEIALSEAMFF